MYGGNFRASGKLFARSFEAAFISFVHIHVHWWRPSLKWHSVERRPHLERTHILGSKLLGVHVMLPLTKGHISNKARIVWQKGCTMYRVLEWDNCTCSMYRYVRFWGWAWWVFFFPLHTLEKNCNAQWNLSLVQITVWCMCNKPALDRFMFPACHSPGEPELQPLSRRAMLLQACCCCCCCCQSWREGDGWYCVLQNQQMIPSLASVEQSPFTVTQLLASCMERCFYRTCYNPV